MMPALVLLPQGTGAGPAPQDPAPASKAVGMKQLRQPGIGWGGQAEQTRAQALGFGLQ